MKTQTAPFKDDRGAGRRKPRTAVGTCEARRVGLVIDDDEATRARIARSMEAGGYEVVTASSYRQAIMVIEERWPDLIYMGIKQGSAAFVERIRPHYEDPIPVQDLVHWMADHNLG